VCINKCGRSLQSLQEAGDNARKWIEHSRNKMKWTGLAAADTADADGHYEIAERRFVLMISILVNRVSAGAVVEI